MDQQRVEKMDDDVLLALPPRRVQRHLLDGRAREADVLAQEVRREDGLERREPVGRAESLADAVKRAEPPPPRRCMVWLTGAIRKKAAPVGKVTQYYSAADDEYYVIDSVGRRFNLNLNRDTMEWTLCTTP